MQKKSKKVKMCMTFSLFCFLDSVILLLKSLLSLNFCKCRFCGNYATIWGNGRSVKLGLSAASRPHQVANALQVKAEGEAESLVQC